MATKPKKRSVCCLLEKHLFDCSNLLFLDTLFHSGVTQFEASTSISLLVRRLRFLLGYLFPARVGLIGS